MHQISGTISGPGIVHIFNFLLCKFGPACENRWNAGSRRQSQVIAGGRCGVVLELFWGCSGVVLGLFWGCSGVVLGLFWGCSGGVLGLRRSFNIQRRRQGYPGQFRELDPMKATPTPRKQPNNQTNHRSKQRNKQTSNLLGRSGAF